MGISRMKRVLLFDIDGTLTRSVYKAGTRNPILDAMSNVFETSITKNGVIFSGGTDRSIIRDVLAANNIQYDQHLDKVDATVELYKQLLADSIARGDCHWESLLNVNELLAACANDAAFQLALVTGNLRECAEMKLKSAGINVDLFKWITSCLVVSAPITLTGQNWSKVQFIEHVSKLTQNFNRQTLSSSGTHPRICDVVI